MIDRGYVHVRSERMPARDCHHHTIWSPPASLCRRLVVVLRACPFVPGSAFQPMISEGSRLRAVTEFSGPPHEPTGSQSAVKRISLNEDRVHEAPGDRSSQVISY